MAIITPPYDLPEIRPFRTIANRLRLQGGAIVTQNGVLQSDDYLAGVSGWAIFGDGTCEFNDGTFRGEIDAEGLNIILTEDNDGAIEFYSSAGNLVGRLTAGSWEIGDLETPGTRAVLDPIGGLRFRDETDQLLTIMDQHGVSIRDPATGNVVTTLDHEALRLEDSDGVTSLALSAVSADTLTPPRYKGLYEANPGTTVVSPTTVKQTNNDLSLGHAAYWRRGVTQAQTHTPNGGWTEVIDTKVGSGSSLAVGLQRLQPATGTGCTTTGTASTWDHGVGTHALVKGVVGGSAPAVRSYSETNVNTAATAVNVSMSKPTGTVAGDVLVVFISMGNNGGGVPIGWTTPAGWVFLGATLGSSGTGPTMSTLAVGCWAFLCDGTEGSTFDTNINFGTGTKTIHAAMICVQNGAVIDGGAQLLVNGYNTLGQWTPYTPTFTNITVGNGTRSGEYLRIGQTCFFQWRFTLGSTSSLTAGGCTVALPFPAARSGVGTTGYQDTSAFGASAPGIMSWGATATTASLFGPNNAAPLGAYISPTSPFTWATTDIMYASGVYEVQAGY